MNLINSGKLAALCAEFVELFASRDERSEGRLVQTNRLETFRVSRISTELLRIRPNCEYEHGAYVCVESEYRIFLLNGGFQVLAEVEPDTEGYSYGSQSGHTERVGEAVGDAILKLKDPTKLQYVLIRHTGFDIQDEAGRRDSIGGYDVTLCKLPKKWSLTDWIETERSRLGLTRS